MNISKDSALVSMTEAAFDGGLAGVIAGAAIGAAVGFAIPEAKWYTPLITAAIGTVSGGAVGVIGNCVRCYRAYEMSAWHDEL